MNFKHFIFNVGYVETTSVGSLMVSHDTGFSTIEKGLEDFVAITEKVVLDVKARWNAAIEFRECCKYSLIDSPWKDECQKCHRPCRVKDLESHTDDNLALIRFLLTKCFGQVEHEIFDYYAEFGWIVPSGYNTEGVSSYVFVHNFRGGLNTMIEWEHGVLSPQGKGRYQK